MKIGWGHKGTPWYMTGTRIWAMLGNTWEYLGIIEATQGHGGHLGTLEDIHLGHTWGYLGTTGDTWRHGGGHLGTPRGYLPPLYPFFSCRLGTGRAGAGLAGGQRGWRWVPAPIFPFSPQNAGGVPSSHLPPDLPFSPRLPWAVQRCIPGWILPGPSWAPLPSWVSDTGHPEWVLHRPPPPPTGTPPFWVVPLNTHPLLWQPPRGS